MPLALWMSVLWPHRWPPQPGPQQILHNPRRLHGEASLMDFSPAMSQSASHSTNTSGAHYAPGTHTEWCVKTNKSHKITNYKGVAGSQALFQALHMSAPVTVTLKGSYDPMIHAILVLETEALRGLVIGPGLCSKMSPPLEP